MAVMQKEEEKTTQIILEVLKNSIFNVTWAIFPIDVFLFFVLDLYFWIAVWAGFHCTLSVIL